MGLYSKYRNHNQDFSVKSDFCLMSQPLLGADEL